MMFIRKAPYVVAIFSLLLNLLSSSPVFADSNILLLNPPSSQMSIGTKFTVNVRSYSQSDTDPGTVSGAVLYPSNLLSITSISLSGSAYGSPSITQSSGSVQFSGSRSPAPSGSVQIFAINFRAKAAGKANVTFRSDSQVNHATTSLKSGLFTITDPNPKPTKTPTPKPTTSTKPAPIVTIPPTAEVETPSTSPKPTPDPTGIVDSVVVSPSYTNGTVSWKVHATNPVSSIAYGLVYSQLDKTATAKQKSKGEFTADITNLLPGKTYYFTITGSGKGGDSGSYTGTLPTRGFPVTIKVTENGNPAKSGLVKIGAQSQPISNGTVTMGLAAGSYTGQITTDTAALNISLTVKEVIIPTDGTVPASQEFPFALTSSVLDGGPGSGAGVFVFVGVLFGGLVLLAAGFFAFITWRRRQFESDGGYAQHSYSGPSVVVEDGYDWHQDADMRNSGSPMTGSAPAPPQPTPPAGMAMHHNSVYLSEEEPVDMFDSANIRLGTNGGSESPPNQNTTPTDGNETPQNSNPPRSTMN